MRLQTCLLTAACAVGFLGAASAANQPFNAQSQSSVTTAPATNITTSIILNVTDPRGLEDFVALVSTPGSPQYHRFLNVNQFVQRFAPSNRQIDQFVRYLESFGITVDKVYADNLDITVTGTAAQLNAAFSTQLRDYTRNGQTFHRPAWKFVLPGSFASLVLSVPGLNNEVGDLHPKNIHVGQGANAAATPTRSPGRRTGPRRESPRITPSGIPPISTTSIRCIAPASWVAAGRSAS